ncbi:MAG TPA: YciI family protein [Polyangia bacterium]|nr:YciI family protein [Polyangia bacterium]
MHPASTKVASSGDGTPTTYYAVILKPVPGRQLSLPIVQRHAQHLAELDAQGTLVMAGPFVDNPLGLLVMKGSSKAEIKHVMSVDPMITSGVRTFEVATWVLATRENKFMPPIPPPQRK